MICLSPLDFDRIAIEELRQKCKSGLYEKFRRSYMTCRELLQIPKSHLEMIAQIEEADGLKVAPIVGDNHKSTMIITKEIEGAIEVFEVSVRKLTHLGLTASIEHLVP